MHSRYSRGGWGTLIPARVAWMVRICHHSVPLPSSALSVLLALQRAMPRGAAAGLKGVVHPVSVRVQGQEPPGLPSIPSSPHTANQPGAT